MNDKNKDKKIYRTFILVLSSIGIANIGEWIYFIALNLIVLNKGGTAFSVGLLYILRPIAFIIMNILSYSIVDSLNKKKWLINLDLIRAMFVGLILINDNLIWIYILVFLIQGASALYEPISISYLALVIPINKRKKFNAWTNLVSSGGFLIGPAIAGLLLTIGTPKFSIIVNVLALTISGLLTIFLPNYKLENETGLIENSYLKENKKGFSFIRDFSKNNKYEIIIYSLITSLFIATAGLDSIEASFAKEVLHLSDGNYGLLVSFAGAGFVIGSILNSLIVDKLSVKQLLLFGGYFYTIGYLIFIISVNFFMASFGFFILSFSLAYINTGLRTFIQTKFPVEKLGQILTTFGILESLSEILMVASIIALSTFIELRIISFLVEVLMIIIIVNLTLVLKKITI